jgi:hypothetical protein
MRIIPFALNGPALFLAVSLLCSSCATTNTTRYVPPRSDETFSESQEAPDQFQVSFYGRAESDIGRAYDLALLRSAELTRKHGFCCFAVMDATNASSLRPYTAHRQVFVQGGATPIGTHGVDPRIDNFGRFQAERFVTVEEPATYFRPGAALRIKCFAGKPEKPFTFNAAEQERSLKSKYRITP